MSNVKDYILKESELVGDTYQMQTEAFSPIEFPLLIDLLNKHNIKTVLDVGTGEGNWISKFAKEIKDIKITSIDADSKLIEVAKKSNNNENIDFQNAMFNKDYSFQKYDCIFARFSMEHVHNPDEFVTEAFKRLNKDGVFVVNEWFIDIHHNANPIWTEWRRKENEFYEIVGGHPRLALSLPLLFKKNGFSSIQSSYYCVSPATVCSNTFYKLTKTYAILYNKLNSKIFSDDFTKELIEYCSFCIQEDKITDDYYLITQTIGIK